MLAGLVVAGALAAVPAARAYVPTFTSTGAQVHWNGTPKLDLLGNPVNDDGISPDTFYSAVVRGLQRWQEASGGRVGFDYWQGTDPSVYIPNSELNGVSSIYFASNSGDSTLSRNILGLTQVWYETGSGHILETDTVLNDRDFTFTTDPRDTSGFGLPRGPSRTPTGFAAKPRVYIENVITHELGHAFGLAHSATLQSTMLYLESPEQAHISCDDAIGIHALYPSDDANRRGAILGRVISESGTPVHGANVQAISRRRGTVLASALTGADGTYMIAGLEPGAYFLMAEPYFAGPQTLPAYYSGINPRICADGRAFSRSFYGLDPRIASPLKPVQVVPGSAARPGAIVARCRPSTGGAAVPEVDTARGERAPVVYDGTSGETGFGFVAEFPTATTSGTSADLEIRNFPGGHLEIRALDYSLYSPIGANVTLLDSDGIPVPAETARVTDDSFVGDSGFIDHDSEVVADGLPPGSYFLRLSPALLSASEYPAGPIALDSVPFALISGSVNEPEPKLEKELPFNSRCRTEENFAEYRSPPGPPPRRNYGDSSQSPQVGFCSTVGRGGGRGSGDGPPNDGSGGPGGAPPAAILGWFLPWLAMAAASRLSVLAKVARGR